VQDSHVVLPVQAVLLESSYTDFFILAWIDYDGSIRLSNYKQGISPQLERH
jgi:hypothetical protein